MGTQVAPPTEIVQAPESEFCKRTGANAIEGVVEVTHPRDLGIAKLKGFKHSE